MGTILIPISQSMKLKSGYTLRKDRMGSEYRSDFRVSILILKSSKLQLMLFSKRALFFSFKFSGPSNKKVIYMFVAGTA